jgi:hypothetical protein
MRLNECAFDVKEDKKERHGYNIATEAIEAFLLGNLGKKPNYFSSIASSYLHGHVNDDWPKSLIVRAAYYLLYAVSVSEYGYQSTSQVLTSHSTDAFEKLIGKFENESNILIGKLEVDSQIALQNNEEKDLAFVESLDFGLYPEIGSVINNSVLNNTLWDSLEKSIIKQELDLEGLCLKVNEYPKVNENVPKYLYKYVSFEVLNLILNNLKIRFTPLNEFNDPFDGQIYPSRNFLVHDLIDAIKNKAIDCLYGKATSPLIMRWKEEVEKVGGETVSATAIVQLLESKKDFVLESKDIIDPNKQVLVRDILVPLIYLSLTSDKFSEKDTEDLLNNIFNGFKADNVPIDFGGVDRAFTDFVAEKVKVLCLTSNSDSLLMWSHYASEHGGAILKIDTTKFSDSMLGKARKVSYVDKSPDIETLDEAANRFFEIENRKPEEKIFDRLAIKSKEWSYEQEWRFFGEHESLDDYGLYTIPVELIDSIYMGDRVDNDKLLSTLEQLNNRNYDINLFKCVRDERFFRMNSIPISNYKLRNNHIDKSSGIYKNYIYQYCLNSSFRIINGSLDYSKVESTLIGKLTDIGNVQYIEQLKILLLTIKETILDNPEIGVDESDTEKYELAKKQKLIPSQIQYQKLKQMFVDDLKTEGYELSDVIFQ